MHPVQQRAVAEVKTSDRIHRLYASLLVQQIVGAERAQGVFHQGIAGEIVVHVLEVGHQSVPDRFGQFVVNLTLQRAAHPGPETGYRGQGFKALEMGQFMAQLGSHLFDQEVTEGDAPQTFVAVTDGVEGGGVTQSRVLLQSVLLNQGANRITAAGFEGHLDKDDRIIGHGGVKIGEQASVILEAAAQITPTADFVHRFVLDQFLQRTRRGIPADATQAEKAQVEPDQQQAFQVIINLL